LGNAARQPEDRLDRVERLLLELRAELRQVARGRAAAGGDVSDLLTKAAVRRLIHCDKATLEAMLRSRRLRGVPAPSGKGTRIPRSELERYQSAGAPSAAEALAPVKARRAARARPRGPAAVEAAAAIRGIPVPSADK
jgi:hypothetical protein